MLQRIDFDSLNTRCVALISAMNADGQCNYYDDVPLLLTRKIKAKYYQWPAPRYAQSADEYEMWCTNRLFRSVSSVAREADVILSALVRWARKVRSLKTALSIRRRWMS